MGVAWLSASRALGSFFFFEGGSIATAGINAATDHYSHVHNRRLHRRHEHGCDRRRISRYVASFRKRPAQAGIIPASLRVSADEDAEALFVGLTFSSSSLSSSSSTFCHAGFKGAMGAGLSTPPFASSLESSLLNLPTTRVSHGRVLFS